MCQDFAYLCIWPYAWEVKLARNPITIANPHHFLSLTSIFSLFMDCTQRCVEYSHCISVDGNDGEGIGFQEIEVTMGDTQFASEEELLQLLCLDQVSCIC